MEKIEGLNRWSKWDGYCPDCGSDEFYQGPEGGLCVNIKCARCKSWFNHMGHFGLERIHWVIPVGCLAVTDLKIKKLSINKVKNRMMEEIKEFFSTLYFQLRHIFSKIFRLAGYNGI